MGCLVLPADGIGPEIVACAVEVLQAADRRFGLNIHLDYDEVGFASLRKHGTTLRQEVLDRAEIFTVLHQANGWASRRLLPCALRSLHLVVR